MSNVVQLYGAVIAPIEATDMEIDTFRNQIVLPALISVDLHSDAAENLLIGTALVESGLNAFVQKGGPALSLFQIEPATYKDCIRYLNIYRNRKLKDRILASCYIDMFPDAQCLTWNLRLATLIARIKYWMQPEALPEARDSLGLARYHKMHYNSYMGDTDLSESVLHFERACK